MALFLLLASVPLLLLGWFVGQPMLRERRREKLRSMPFPAAWRSILRRRVPAYRGLPHDLQRQLQRHVQVFLAEKQFIGCAGQAINDEVRITIAAQACLLLLNRRARYFPGLRQILVYPGAFLVERLRPEPSGVLQETRNVLSGESWANGQVILSWEDSLAGAADAHDGRNVVIHEFAHQLDQEKGHANGAPLLSTRRRYELWSKVLAEEYQRLQHSAVMQQPTLLSHYGATNPAEFFAVASEVFFEQPHAMQRLHPGLYGELQRFYRVDPAGWQ